MSIKVTYYIVLNAEAEVRIQLSSVETNLKRFAKTIKNASLFTFFENVVIFLIKFGYLCEHTRNSLLGFSIIFKNIKGPWNLPKLGMATLTNILFFLNKSLSLL